MHALSRTHVTFYFRHGFVIILLGINFSAPAAADRRLCSRRLSKVSPILSEKKQVFVPASLRPSSIEISMPMEG